MPPRLRTARRLFGLGVKYAPLAYEGLRHGRRPAQEMAQRQMTRRTAKTIAMEHAAHLVDGSVLPVYDGDTRVWVVFSGDLPVATHPVVSTPVEELLEHYDLSRRIVPPTPTRGRRPPTGNGGPAGSTDTPVD